MIDLKQGDCLELMDKIPDKSIDMILCDLPYGTTTCKWDTVISFAPLWKQYKRIIKDRGQIVLFATEPFTSQLVNSNLKWYREHLTWIKHRASNFAAAKHLHMKYTEDIIVFGNGSGTYNPQMQKRISSRVKEMHKVDYNIVPGRKSDVSFKSKRQPINSKRWDSKLKYPMDYLPFPAVTGNSKEKTIHPTQKPVKLLEYLIKKQTAKNLSDSPVNGGAKMVYSSDYNPEYKNPIDVIEFANHFQDGNRLHPTQKPVSLLKYLIKTYTRKGETVLDNCMGSGSTGVACVNLNRNFIGMELDDEYFHIAHDRILKADSNKQMKLV